MRYFLPGLFAILLFSCDNVSAPPGDVPTAFEETKSEGFKSKYGGREDVVTSMYNDVVNDDANLKSLEKDIRNIPGTVSDAASPFHSFDNNNDSYYSSASMHVNSIKDSALKQQVRMMVENSKTQYTRSIARHNTLINEIKWKQLTLNDVHTYLMLVKTLPAIESYQKKNIPSTTPLENVSAELDKLIQRTKDATKP